MLGKHSHADLRKSHKGVPFLLPQQFFDNSNHMLNTNIKNVPNFVKISPSSMKKS